MGLYFVYGGGSRRWRIIRVGYRFLEGVLRQEDDGPDTWVTTDVPDDLRIVNTLGVDERQEVMLLVESASFEEVPEGAVPLTFEPLYTRHRAS